MLNTDEIWPNYVMQLNGLVVVEIWAYKDYMSVQQREEMQL